MSEASELCRQLITRTGGHFYFEISPLVDASWTGIPVVAANFARQLLLAIPDGVSFFFNGRLVATAAVEDALRRDTGADLKEGIDSGRADGGRIPALHAGFAGVGIYPSVKRSGGIFAVEIGFIHDCSTMITPQYHVVTNIEYHMESLIGDLETNDLTVCVSDATRSDVQAYLGYPQSRLVVAHNGVSWPQRYEAETANPPGHPRPYIYILGTLEPRKNLALIARLLEHFPEIIERYWFVISGHSEWQNSQQGMPSAIAELAAIGKVTLTGYVDDLEKYRLLRHAYATIYPSLFEGFGLPVLESLSAGTPCIASFSSSIPEIGGEHCRYFDPFSAEDLYRAINALAASPTDAAGRARLKAAAAKFSWERSLLQVLRAAEPIILAKAAKAG